MTLGSPQALLLLLLALPVLWAYLRRPPLPERRTGSLLLYRALGALPVRRRRLEPHRLLSLLLVLATLLLLSLRLALQPEDPRPVIVLLDRSASMGTVTEGGQTRLERAREALDRFLAAHPDTPVGLVETPPLQQRLRPGLDHRRLIDLVREARPAGEQEDPSPLLHALCTEDQPRILLLSESINLPPDLPCPVFRPDLGGSAAGAGLVGLSARSADGLGLVEIQVETGHESPVAMSLSVEGSARREVEIQGGQLLWLELPTGGEISLSLPEDALVADDRASVRIGAGGAVRTLLVTEDADGYAATALRAHPRVQLSLQPPANPPPSEPVDLLVLEAPVAGPLPPARRILALGLDPRLLGIEAGPEIPRPRIRAQAEDPLLRWVSLDDLKLSRARVLLPPPDAIPLLEAEQGALALRIPQDGDQELILTGFSLQDSDLGLRAGFVNLVANLVEEAAPPEATAVPTGLLSRLESAGRVLPGAGLPEGPGLPGRLLGLAGLAGFGLLVGESLLGLRRKRA